MSPGLAPINHDEVSIRPEEYNDLPRSHKQAIRGIVNDCEGILFIQKQYAQDTRIEVRTETPATDPDILNNICNAGCAVEYIGRITEDGHTFGEVIFDANTS
jgi:hypothetical protein